jgi:hypothetical protein
VTAKLLPLADAFRAIVRANAPEREDLQQINSYRWFHDRQRIVVGDPIEGDNLFDHLFCRGTLVAAPADQPAYEALRLLRDGVASAKIRLRGILKTAHPADVDPIHAREGDLDIFAGTLTFEHRDIFNTKTTYTNLHCYADDLPQPKGKGGRPRRFDPAAVAAEVQRLMDYHGEFRPDDPEWDAQARLTDAVRSKFGEAADSTIEDYIKEPLAKWRDSKRPKT